MLQSHIDRSSSVTIHIWVRFKQGLQIATSSSLVGCIHGITLFFPFAARWATAGPLPPRVSITCFWRLLVEGCKMTSSSSIISGSPRHHGERICKARKKVLGYNDTNQTTHSFYLYHTTTEYESLLTKIVLQRKGDILGVVACLSHKAKHLAITQPHPDGPLQLIKTLTKRTLDIYGVSLRVHTTTTRRSH